jgi:molybdopterin converting factor small subunit
LTPSKQAIVHVPASLRQFSGGAARLCVDVPEPITLEALFRRLQPDYPGVVDRALDENGKIRQHVNVFIDGESLSRDGSSLGLHTPVGAGSEVWILPAVSGGSGG